MNVYVLLIKNIFIRECSITYLLSSFTAINDATKIFYHCMDNTNHNFR